MSISLGILLSGATLQLAALGILCLNRLSAPRLGRGAEATPSEERQIEVLIPVRDEMGNLPALLDAWSEVPRGGWILRILDDGSRDGSLEWLERKSEEPRWRGVLQVLRGASLPEGWRGKNWACHQLSLAAEGTHLLFADADVRPRPWALQATMDLALAEKAGLVSAFGRQSSSHPLAESLIGLMVDLPVHGLLPLRLAANRPEPSLCAAIGQWMFFERDLYHRIGGHASVASAIAEDLAMARAAKASGSRVVPALAKEAIEVQMYGSPSGAVAGFSKNFRDLGGGGVAGWIASTSVAFLLLWFPVLVLFWSEAGICRFLPFLFTAALVAGSSPDFGAALRRLLSLPLGAFLVLMVALRSLLNPWWPLAWKGRKL